MFNYLGTISKNQENRFIGSQLILESIFKNTLGTFKKSKKSFLLFEILITIKNTLNKDRLLKQFIWSVEKTEIDEKERLSKSNSPSMKSRKRLK